MSTTGLLFTLDSPLVQGARDPHTRERRLFRTQDGAVCVPASTVRGALASQLALREDALTGARVLAWPARALESTCVWLMSAHTARALVPMVDPLLDDDAMDAPLSAGEAWYDVETSTGDVLYAEERSFARAGGLPNALRAALAALLPETSLRDRLLARLVVITDEDAAWMSRNTLPVRTRAALHERKRMQSHWREEQLPRDTVLLATLDAPDGVSNSASDDALFVQLGAGASIGQGLASAHARPLHTGWAVEDASPHTPVPRALTAQATSPRVAQLAGRLHHELRRAGLGTMVLALETGRSRAHRELRAVAASVLGGPPTIQHLNHLPQQQYAEAHEQLAALLASIHAAPVADPVNP